MRADGKRKTDGPRHDRRGKLFRAAAAVLVSAVLFLSGCGTPQGSGAVSAGTRQTPDRTGTAQKLTVSYIDVGQGDCTLLQCGGQSLLIDAGDPDSGTAVQLYLRKHGVSGLTYLVLTHPDSDHTGGAPVIITKFSPERAFVSGFAKTTRTAEKVSEAFSCRNIVPEVPERGETFSVGSAEAVFVSPTEAGSDANNSSLCLYVRNGSDTFLFTGDAEEEEEKKMLSYGVSLKAEVYKTGHHGSRTAAYAPFIAAVAPEYAVISCGDGNSYGHPHAETLNLLRAAGTEVRRTDEEGTVCAVTSGNGIQWSVPPSVTWQTGSGVSVTGKTAGTGQGKTSEKTAGTSAQGTPAAGTGTDGTAAQKYVLNTSSKKFHLPSCRYAGQISERNRKTVTETAAELEAEGYTPCGVCRP